MGKKLKKNSPSNFSFPGETPPPFPAGDQPAKKSGDPSEPLRAPWFLSPPEAATDRRRRSNGGNRIRRRKKRGGLRHLRLTLRCRALGDEGRHSNGMIKRRTKVPRVSAWERSSGKVEEKARGRRMEWRGQKRIGDMASDCSSSSSSSSPSQQGKSEMLLLCWPVAVLCWGYPLRPPLDPTRPDPTRSIQIKVGSVRIHN